MDASRDLRGHRALITGAGRRLGRAFALALAARGADVAIHYHSSREGAQEVADQAAAMEVRSAIVQADLTRPDQADGIVQAAADSLGPIDWLVNSASLFEPVSAPDMSLDDWARHMRVNLTSPVFLIRALARHLDGRNGTAVNLLDWRALRPGPDHFPYTVSKAGLAAATQALARAYAPHLRVNGLALGAILPPSDGRKGKGPGPIQDVPADRWGTVDEAIDGLIFLLGGPAYTTGQILFVDGGRHLV